MAAPPESLRGDCLNLVSAAERFFSSSASARNSPFDLSASDNESSFAIGAGAGWVTAFGGGGADVIASVDEAPSTDTADSSLAGTGGDARDIALEFAADPETILLAEFDAANAEFELAFAAVFEMLAGD